jgi:Bacterial DNA-binding protein
MDFMVESLETPALTKAQLADMLFDQIGLNKRESKDMIDAFFELIAKSVVLGENLRLRQFPNPHQSPAPWPQPPYRRTHPYRLPPRGDVSCEP